MTYPFVQAKNFTPAKRGAGDIELVVIHSMEATEKGNTAENVAAWFAGPNAPQASAHFCVDNDSVVACVREADVAWHAPGANRNGIGIEHAGYARQTAAEWADEYSTAMLRRSAVLCAELCARYGIPVTFVDAAALKTPGARGITTHKAVTDGLNGGKGHVDPGEWFPMAQYLAWVREALPAPAPAIAAPDGWVRVGDWLVAPNYEAPVGIGQAAAMALERGYELPTPELVDAIWRAADMRIDPRPQTFTAWTSKEMASESAIEKQRAYVESTVAGRPFTLLAGAYKDVVRVGNIVGIYGWHHLDGQPIQHPYFAHAPSWLDYSQGVRFVRRA